MTRTVSSTKISEAMRPSTMLTMRSATSRMRLSCVTSRIGAALAPRQLLEHRDDFTPRHFVERGGRLVCQDEPRPVDQGAGDRDALALSARQLGRLVVNAVRRVPAASASRWPFRRVPRACPGGVRATCGRSASAVNESNRLCAWKMKPMPRRTWVSSVSLSPRSSRPRSDQAALLDAAQPADERQQRALPGAGRPRHDHHLAGHQRDVVVLQNLFARLAGAEKVIHTAHLDRRLDPLGEGVEVADDDGGLGVVHQNTSAGSDWITRRIAIAPASRHIAIVATRTTSARPIVRRIRMPE